MRPYLLGLVTALVLTGGCGSNGGHGSGAGSTTAPATSTSTQNAPVTTGVTTAPVATAAPTPRTGTWLKGDFHVHSSHSGDATSYGDDISGVIKAAEVAGLDFFSMTDHRQATCLTDPQFTNATTKLILIAGEEWGQPGHAGAHGLTRDPIYHEQDQTQGAAVCVQKIQQTIDDVHSMGGVFVLNHAVDAKNAWYWPVSNFDGIEVWNQSWALGSAADQTDADVRAWAQGHGLDQPGGPSTPQEAFAAVSVRGGGQNWQRTHLYEAYLTSTGRHLAAIGGGDTHYLFLPGSPTTRVFAETPTKDAILKAVREGRTIVQRSPDAPLVELNADVDNKGFFDKMIGDSVPLGHPVTFKIHVKDDTGGKVQLVKNGTIVQEWKIGSADFTTTYQDTPGTKSWYRLNVEEPLDLTLPNTKLLKDLILGVQSAPWLQSLLGLGILGANGAKIANALNSGVPALGWLLVYGGQAGVRVSPGSTNYPRLEVPPAVSRWLNMAVHDDGYAMGAVTSPIWAE